MEVISESSLKKLKEHKYSASGTSLVEPYMQIYWRWLVEQIPTTWAPNTLTVVGLILNVVTSTLLFMFSPDGKTEVIVYMFCRSMFVLLFFFFWPLCCLSFFDIQILIAPLVSSNFSF